ncbi:hypothetical protein CCP3SC1_780007 [Gammaproteobacteria bacterium]
MNLTQPLLISILAEFSIALVCVLGIWSFLALRRRRRDMAAALALVESVRREEPMHLSQMRGFISRVVQGGNSSSIAERLLEEERNFYKHFIRIYLKRDADAFAMLPDEVKKLWESYSRLFASDEGDAAFSSPSQISELDHYLGEEGPTPLQELRALQEAHSQLEARFEHMQKTLQGYTNTSGKGSPVPMSTAPKAQFTETLEMRAGATQLLPEFPSAENFDTPQEDEAEPEFASEFGAGLEFESALEPESESVLGPELGSESESAFESMFESTTEPALEFESEAEAESKPEIESESELEFGLEFGLEAESEPESEPEAESEFSMEQSFMEETTESVVEETFAESPMEGFMESPEESSTESFAETSPDAPAVESEEFAWDNALLSTDVLDFDVLQLEEVAMDRPNTPKGSTVTPGRGSTGANSAPVQNPSASLGSSEFPDSFGGESISTSDEETEGHLRNIVIAAEESWRETGITSSASSGAGKGRKR